MKIELVHVTRRPPWPLWAVLLVLIWLGLGAILVWMSIHFERPVQLCLIKRLTGFACPTCGFTRGALSLLHGRIIQAWLYNPLLYTFLSIFFGVTAVRIIFARSFRINLTGNERLFAWLIAIVLFFTNWVYVLLYVH
jgi:hypothetical protein